MKILIAGTFDIIHPGHIMLFWRAKRTFKGELYVIVARDENVIRFKGAPPVLEDKIRAYILSNIKPVDYVILGSRNVLEPIFRIKPDVIVLGHDQRPSESRLRESLASKGLRPKIIRAPRFDDYSSSNVKKAVYEWYLKYRKRFETFI